MSFSPIQLSNEDFDGIFRDHVPLGSQPREEFEAHRAAEASDGASSPPPTIVEVEPEPQIPDYGLRVERQNSTSMILSWLSDISPPCSTCADLDHLGIPSEPHCWYYELQMRKKHLDDQLENAWQSVYKGHKSEAEVKALDVDDFYIFRLKKSCDIVWGCIVESYAACPPLTFLDKHEAAKLNLFVDRNMGGELRQWIRNTDRRLLKKLLRFRHHDGMEPIHFACEKGQLDIVEMLVEAGSDINSRCEPSEMTPLMMACWNDHLEVVKYLHLGGANWSLRDRSGCNTIHHSAIGSSLESLKYALSGHCPDCLVDERDAIGETPLMKAATMGTSLQIVQYLLQKGVNENSVDNSNSNSILMAAVRSGNAEIVKQLLRHSADPNYANSKKEYCLDLVKSDTIISKLLLDAGGFGTDYVEYTYENGRTVLEHVTRSEADLIRGTPESRVHELACTSTLRAKNRKRRSLRGHGYEIEVNQLEDGDSEFSGLKESIQQQKITIVQGCANCPPVTWVQRVKTKEGKRYRYASQWEKGLIESGCIIINKNVLRNHLSVYENFEGVTQLMIVCENENEMVEVMLETRVGIKRFNGVCDSTDLAAFTETSCKDFLEILKSIGSNGNEWNLRDKSGCNAFTYAVISGSMKSLMFALEGNCPDCVLDERDNLGETPLMKAVSVGKSLEIVQLLLDSGSSVNSVDNSEMNSILTAAVRSGNADIVQLILENGANSNFTNCIRDNPLDIAKRGKKQAIVDLVLKAGGRSGGYVEYIWDNGRDVHIHVTRSQAESLRLLTTPSPFNPDISLYSGFPLQIVGSFTLMPQYADIP